jgi:hypothetical protein
MPISLHSSIESATVPTDEAPPPRLLAQRRRSPMAEAFSDRDAPPDLGALSAGDHPADHVRPEVAEVMREVGAVRSTRATHERRLEQLLRPLIGELALRVRPTVRV